MADNIEEKARHLMDVRTLIFTSIISALGFVVGLFWNDAIRSAIERLLPPGEGVFYKFVAAAIVTIIVVIVIYILVRSQRGIRELSEELVRKRLAKKKAEERSRRKKINKKK